MSFSIMADEYKCVRDNENFIINDGYFYTIVTNKNIKSVKPQNKSVIPNSMITTTAFEPETTVSFWVKALKDRKKYFWIEALCYTEK